MEDVKTLSAGSTHTLVLTLQNKVLQLGLDQQRLWEIEKYSITSLVAGSYLSAAITSEQTLLIWDNLTPHEVTQMNDIAQVKLSTNPDHPFVAAIDTHGRLFLWGSNSFGQLGTDDLENRDKPTCVQRLARKSITQVALGSGFVIALGQTSTKLRDKLSLTTHRSGGSTRSKSPLTHSTKPTLLTQRTQNVQSPR